MRGTINREVDDLCEQTKHAEVIEEKLGKEALAKTVIDGPNHILDAYNSIVEDTLRIVL